MNTICPDCGNPVNHKKVDHTYTGKLMFNPELVPSDAELCMDCRSKSLDVEGPNRARRRAIFVTVVLMMLLVPVAILNLLASKRLANEGSAQSSIRTFHSAEAVYQATDGDGNFGSLEALATAGLIDDRLASGRKSGYVFAVSKVDKTSSDTPATFTVTAVPLSFGTLTATGSRSFYIDERGVIYFNRTGSAPVRTLEGSDGIPLGP